MNFLAKIGFGFDIVACRVRARKVLIGIGPNGSWSWFPKQGVAFQKRIEFGFFARGICYGHLAPWFSEGRYGSTIMIHAIKLDIVVCGQGSYEESECAIWFQEVLE